MLKIKNCCFAYCAFVISQSVTTVFSAGPMLTGNPLANLPSQPGSTIASIQAMGDNTWFNLGAPAGDPVFGKAFGRSWSGSGFVLSPDLRGAMLTGEGVHAYVKPDGYGMDDWWFYDINAHRWICIFPGTDTKSFNQQVTNGDIAVDSLGRAVDTSGQPVPGHIMIHSYHWLTYNPDIKKFALFPTWAPFGKYFMPGGSAVDAGIDALNAQGMNQGGVNFGPWTYDIQTGRFARDRAVNACPLGNGPDDFSLFQYSQSSRKYFITDRGGSAFFDPSTRTWSAGMSPQGLTSYDFSGCYDSRRNRVYVGNSSSNFHCYDIQINAWTKITMAGSVGFSTNSGAITYDSLADRVLVFNFTSGNSVYPLNPATNTFESTIPFGSAFASARKPQNSVFYDPGLGAHFIYSAYDSQNDGIMWVYKFKKFAVAAETARSRSSGFSAAAHPNPFKGRVQFTLPGGFGKGTAIRVHDAAGRLAAVLSAGGEEGGLSWDASGRTPGLFFVTATKGNLSARFKVLLLP